MAQHTRITAENLWSILADRAEGNAALAGFWDCIHQLKNGYFERSKTLEGRFAADNGTHDDFDVDCADGEHKVGVRSLGDRYVREYITPESIEQAKRIARNKFCTIAGYGVFFVEASSLSELPFEDDVCTVGSFEVHIVKMSSGAPQQEVFEVCGVYLVM